MLSKAIFLENYPILNNNELIEEILLNGELQKIPAGEILIDLDEKLIAFPLLLNGSIKISREDDDGNEVFLYYVDAGNTCAATLTCCMSSKKSNIRAVVEEDAEFIMLPFEFMDVWMSKYKEWREFILTTYSIRFEELLKAVDQLAFKKMDERIENYLIEKSKLAGLRIIHTSHQEIAIDLNTSREVVSRILKQMEKNNLIKMGRGKIELINI